MGIAYFIVLDDAGSDIDAFVNGKDIARAADQLTEFCDQHGLKALDDFHSQDFSDFLDDEDGDDIETEASDVEEKWFDAQEGIAWVDALIAKLQTEKPAFEFEDVISDLHEYREVFEQASKVDAKWHFELDF
jgi:hypothetical protein